MNVNHSTSELLDAILSLSGLNYLSDLHDAENRTGVRLAIGQIDPGGYSASAWNGAAAYILRREVAFPSGQDAAALLIEALE